MPYVTCSCEVPVHKFSRVSLFHVSFIIILTYIFMTNINNACEVKVGRIGTNVSTGAILICILSN